MQPMNVPAGAQIMLGAPAQPMPQTHCEAIGRAVAQIEGILEAHLPQCYVANVMEGPAQILVLVLHSPNDVDRMLGKIDDLLRTCLPEGATLDLWPIESTHPILNDVRGAGCQIYASSTGNQESPEPWWKFWQRKK